MAMGRRHPRAARGVNKYGAIRETVDGINFASRAEARHYQDLKMLEKAGQLRTLELQPRFPLNVHPGDGEQTAYIGTYIADFRYQLKAISGESWETVVDDVKGVEVPLQQWKRRHAELQYGITVRIVRRRS
jgi:dsDNA-binding SOS-regulon protein